MTKTKIPTEPKPESDIKQVFKDFLDNDSRAQVTEQVTEQATEMGKKLAGEATVFIKNNPWAAVLGAAAIGYLLGSFRAGSSGSRK